MKTCKFLSLRVINGVAVWPKKYMKYTPAGGHWFIYRLLVVVNGVIKIRIESDQGNWVFKKFRGFARLYQNLWSNNENLGWPNNIRVIFSVAPRKANRWPEESDFVSKFTN
jgi:hypothetical protein